MNNNDKILIHCDGGCRGNQTKNNVGGWGYLMRYKEFYNENYGGTKNTTNNIMELTACINALTAVKKKGIPTEVTTDSNYLVKGINEWIKGWKKRGWKTANGSPVKNRELWEKLDHLANEFNSIKFIHCYGHGTNEGNIRADALANLGMDQQHLL